MSASDAAFSEMCIIDRPYPFRPAALCAAHPWGLGGSPGVKFRRQSFPFCGGRAESCTMKTRRLVRAALIAGIYVALCLISQPLAYGGVQFRISEALTLLPVFTPDAVWAVTLGCFLANLLSYSPWDLLFGTAATLTAAVLTWKLRRFRTKGGVPILALSLIHI